MKLRTDPDGIAPERALVFEVAGSLPDFYDQVRRIPGLSFLVDEEIDLDPDDDFFLKEKGKSNGEPAHGTLKGHLYMAMPDLRALQNILSLWKLFTRGQPLPWGFAPWQKLFELLHDLRAWGPQDRIPPDTIMYWKQQIASAPQNPVRLEVELWFFEDNDKQRKTQGAVTTEVSRLDGSVISATVIDSIRYHGMLIELPASRIEELIQHPTVTLARVDEIMYIRPQSRASYKLRTHADDSSPETESSMSTVELQGPPLAAILDGVPVENHIRLAGRLLVDDPDDFSSATPVSKREHGTSMASLIIHGDLNASEPPLSRPLYFRPIMHYNTGNNEESTPSDQIPLDIVYRAIQRIKNGEPGIPPTAPSVVVINLSLGDANRPFTGRISPWARLIDWLSFQHRVLFIVSAGNIRSWLPLRCYATHDEFRNANPQERALRILEALNDNKSFRTILSPSESVNALTIGAWHADAAPEPVPNPFAVDPFPKCDLPNVTSALGLGYRRTIKPDLLFDGGRELLRSSIDEGHVWIIDGGYSGQLSASPDISATGRLNEESRSCGTSNAAALITRAAVRILDALLAAGMEVPVSHQAAVAKALLTHGAAWADSDKQIDAILSMSGRAHLARRDNVARFLGYGRPNIDRVLACTVERATMLGFGDLQMDQEDYYEIPLPPSLEAATEFRRLTLTLAWLSPVNPRHQNYRASTLEILPGGDKSFSLAVSRSGSQPNHYAVERGTVFHCTYEGTQAVAFLDEGYLKLRVVCRGQAGRLEARIPYALAISLETAIGSKIPIYEEMKIALRTRVRTAIRTQ